MSLSGPAGVTPLAELQAIRAVADELPGMPGHRIGRVPVRDREDPAARPRSRDEVILEISTYKVDTEVPSPSAGVITAIMFQEGDTVEVGA